MSEVKQGVLARGLLGLLAVVMLVFTLPAYGNTSNNPALANLSDDTASLGSVAGAFLARQFGLALIALYGAIRGTREPMLIGAFAIAFLNLHDALFLTSYGNIGPGAIAGAVLGAVACGVMLLVWRKTA